MPNIATVLKDEITRLARKEVRRETAALQKASSLHRRDIATLKREVAKLQRQVGRLGAKVLGGPPERPAAVDRGRARFTAKGLRSQRKRLGLSAADYASLVGVTPQSIYNWERETSLPRREQVTAIAALRGIGKKDVQARLRQITAKRKKR